MASLISRAVASFRATRSSRLDMVPRVPVDAPASESGRDLSQPAVAHPVIRPRGDARDKRTAYGLVLVGPRCDVDLVPLCVCEGPPLGRVRVADQVAAGRESRRHARLRFVLRDVDIDVDPVALRTRRVHLLEPERWARQTR